jgi:TPR repeat protein
MHSCRESGNDDKCPFCNSDRGTKSDEDRVEELKKRVEANDPASMFVLAHHYHHTDLTKATELYARSADLGNSKAHYRLGYIYEDGGNLKKAKIHYEAAAMAGHEGARTNLGTMEHISGKRERALKHWVIAASAGDCNAMYNLLVDFEEGLVCRDVIDSTLIAYNTSCAEMRSEARDAFIQEMLSHHTQMK